jgi:hypothetical protein
MMPKADVVDLSSSDIEALLDSLFVSPACDSLVSHPRMGVDGGSFEDWTKANDIAVTVYISLSVDALSSQVPTVDAPHDGQKSCVGDPSVRELHSQLTLMKKTHRRKPAPSGAPRKRTKRAKVNVECSLEMPAPRGGSLLTTNFDRSEWEIMYPFFVVEGLVDPSEHVNRGST